MYPFIRMAKELHRARRMPPLAIGETHVSHHRCWPHDLDFWFELNNGRTLTIMDLGRVPMALRGGLLAALRRNGWGLTIAGSVLCYRRRVRVFDRIELRSRLIGWDHRFFYIEQAMWRPDGVCANQAVFRSAVTSRDGIVPPAKVAADMGVTAETPELPDWVKSWIVAEDMRPWPPAP